MDEDVMERIDDDKNIDEEEKIGDSLKLDFQKK